MRLLLRRGQDVAYVLVCAVAGVKQLAALEQGLELCLQREEVADPCPNVSELGVQERGDVLAGGGPLVT